MATALLDQEALLGSVRRVSTYSLLFLSSPFSQLVVEQIMVRSLCAVLWSSCRSLRQPQHVPLDTRTGFLLVNQPTGLPALSGFRNP